ncbi:uncharacterized protein LOC128394352 [Panonychus citri]|nr:uncharacterized protein LOC128394352 [Panonychus citri]
MMDNLQVLCSRYFLDNFNICKLPTVLKSLSSVTDAPYQFGLINKQIINHFINRHFDQISYTQAFLNFSAETIEYICKLDLIIDSECQVFDAITRWIQVNEDERKIYKDQLMKCIRWNHCNEQDMEKIRSNHGNIGEVEKSSNSNDGIKNRVIVKFLVAIYKLSETVIQLRAYKNSNRWINCGEFTLKNDLCCNLITNDSITDIVYGFGTKGIRLDWKEKKFKYLNMFGDENSYYGQMFKYIMDDPSSLGSGKWITLEPDTTQSLSSEELNAVEMILYHKGKFNAIGKHIIYNTSKYGKRVSQTFLVYQSPVMDQSLFSTDPETRSAHACIINNSIYKLDESLDFQECDVSNPKMRTLKFIDEKLSFENLELLNHNDDLILCDKDTKKAYKYNSSKNDWQFLFEIRTEKKLITMVSIHLLNSYPQTII